MWAIAPRGIGREVGARRIRESWPLVADETFTAAEWHDGLVLAEDGKSLRVRLVSDPIDREPSLQEQVDALKVRLETLESRR